MTTRGIPSMGLLVYSIRISIFPVGSVLRSRRWPSWGQSVGGSTGFSRMHIFTTDPFLMNLKMRRFFARDLHNLSRNII